MNVDVVAFASVEGRPNAQPAAAPTRVVPPPSSGPDPSNTRPRARAAEPVDEDGAAASVMPGVL